jgi:hypothetical protein
MIEISEEIINSTDKCFVYITESRSGCDIPVIYICNDDYKYKFDTYGNAPANYREWDDLLQYGSFGFRGKTNNIDVVYSALFESMKKLKKPIFCSRDVYKELCNSVYKDNMIEVI